MDDATWAGILKKDLAVNYKRVCYNSRVRTRSSVDRALASGARCRRFDSYRAYHGIE